MTPFNKDFNFPIDPQRHEPLFNPRVAPLSRRQPHYVAHTDDGRADSLEKLSDKLGMLLDVDHSEYAEYKLTLLGCTVPIRDELVIPILTAKMCQECKNRPADVHVTWGFDRSQQADLCQSHADELYYQLRAAIKTNYLQWSVVDIKRAA